MPDTCKGCGQSIIWVLTESGKPMPLSVASKEKRFIIKPRTNDRLEAQIVDTYLSHFADCVVADKFRKKKEGA